MSVVTCRRLWTMLGALLAVALACSNPFAPKTVKPPGGVVTGELKEQTTPNALFDNMIFAFRNKDIDAYENLLDPDYVYFSPSRTDDLDLRLNRTEDVRILGRIFEGFEDIDLEFQGTGQRYTERGEEFPDHPDEDWEVFQRPVNISLLNNDGVDGFSVLQDMIFRLRQDPETQLWRVREWEDVITN